LLFSNFMRGNPNIDFALPPDGSEVLSRFLFSKSRYSVEKARVKPSAFMPESRSLETSVFRTLGLKTAQIWALAERYVVAENGPGLHGCGQVLASAVYHLGLTVQADNTPPRHAAIVGWPAEKDKQQILALELAEKANLLLR
jgi:hypothetical protein